MVILHNIMTILEYHLVLYRWESSGGVFIIKYFNLKRINYINYGIEQLLHI